MSKFCQKCGAENVDNAEFCVKCGVALTETPQPESSSPTYVPQAQQPAQKPKKPVYKKWWFWVLIIVIVIIIAAALGGGDDTTDPSNSTGNPSNSQQAEADNDTMQGSGTLGEYDIEIVSVRVGKATYGSDEYIIVKYKWTNNSDDAISFAFAFDDKVYQDDIECIDAIVGDDKYTANQNLSDLKAGGTQELEVSYRRNGSSDIEVEVGELISFSDKKVVKTFILN